jgi:predicted NBD/HSP70 family sugar kinase
VLYEIRPEAGYVLGLDIGHEYLRGAVTDLTGEIRAKAESRCTAVSVRKRVSELIKLADGICSAAGIARDEVTQTVLGTPGVYDPRLDAITLTGGMAGWDRPAVLADLRRAFGVNVAVENDTDAAALAEREHGHGREFASFVFVSIGTGIGMGLVLGGQLHRGAHGVAGEIAFLPITEGPNRDVADDEVRRRGTLEAVGSAEAIVRAGRKAGLTAQSARQVFAAAAAGEQRAVTIVSAEARLVARAICAIIAVVDPGLVVLGGGIGQAPGFAAAVGTELAQIAPVLPELRVSALGTSAVVDGCLASGADLAWRRLTAQLAQPSSELAPAEAAASEQAAALDDAAAMAVSARN